MILYAFKHVCKYLIFYLDDIYYVCFDLLVISWNGWETWYILPIHAFKACNIAVPVLIQLLINDQKW